MLRHFSALLHQKGDMTMQKLSVEDIVKNNESCYSFVVAIAKRARQLSEKADEEGIMLEEKPVQTAVKEFVEGKFRILPKQPVNGKDEDGKQED